MLSKYKTILIVCNINCCWELIIPSLLHPHISIKGNKNSRRHLMPSRILCLRHTAGLLCFIWPLDGAADSGNTFSSAAFCLCLSIDPASFSLEVTGSLLSQLPWMHRGLLLSRDNLARTGYDFMLQELGGVVGQDASPRRYKSAIQVACGLKNSSGDTY